MYRSGETESVEESRPGAWTDIIITAVASEGYQRSGDKQTPVRSRSHRYGRKSGQRDKAIARRQSPRGQKCERAPYEQPDRARAYEILYRLMLRGAA